jgi:lipid-binding SYLF domain-containing protein
MKIKKSLMIVALLFMAIGTFAQNDDNQRIMKDAEIAKQKLLDKDSGLEKFFESSAGYVIFPNVGEGGFIIGAASGNGVVYENGVAIGMANLKKIDVGFQIGGQAIIEVIFFEDEEALTEFKTDEFTVTGEVSATAVKTGVSENLNYSDSVLFIAMPKAGAMADASVGGQRFKFTPMDEIE